jgi:PEP-CTERM motif
MMKSEALNRVFFTAIAIALVGGAVLAVPVTYTYTGNDYNQFVQMVTFNTSDRVTGSFSLSAALPANLGLTDITDYAGFDFNFDNGVMDFGPPSVTPHWVEYFKVATGADGNITNWNIELNLFRPEIPAIGRVYNEWHLVSTTPSRDSGHVLFYDGALGSPGYTQAYFDRGERLGAPGAWVRTGAPTPPPGDSIPEPATALLLGAGLLGLAAVRKRRK